jgi:alkylation response protein AidB-like acyl-CoA dehydrogenase
VDLSFNEEQKMLQKSVTDLANQKFAPIADELDSKQEFAWDNFKLLCNLGFSGMGIPEEYGGSGANKVSEMIVMMEIARACASTCDIMDTHHLLCTEPIYLYGSERQRRKYLPLLIKGEKVGSFALTEPEAGSDVSAIKTTAIRDGSDYVINGSKIFMTNGDVAGIGIVFANVLSLGKRGMTAFIIEDGMPGFSKGKKYNKLGMRAATNCDFIFDNCRVPSENRLGEEGQGMKICLATLDRGRLGIAAQSIGIAQAVLDRAVDYSKQRVQFGTPIGQNQAIAWMLADMSTQLEAARLLAFKAAILADHNEPFTVYASMAKLFASELCMDTATKGIQIYGGYGYMMDSPMQRYFRDAKLTTIYEGTSEVQRMVISRNLLR